MCRQIGGARHACAPICAMQARLSCGCALAAAPFQDEEGRNMTEIAQQLKELRAEHHLTQQSWQMPCM